MRHRSRFVLAILAVFGAGGVLAGPTVARSSSASPTITEFGTAAGLPSASGPTGIAAGFGGNLWFTQLANPGGISSFSPTAPAFSGWTYSNSAIVKDREPAGIAVGPDGNLWFTQQKNPGAIVRFDPVTATATTYATTTSDSGPTDIAAGADGALWFTETAKNRIGRITTSGTITEYPIPTPSSDPRGITLGPDGALWFAESAFSARKIGRIDPATGAVTEYPLPFGTRLPWDLVAASDGALWFTEVGVPGGAIGRITTSGSVTGEFSFAGTGTGPMAIAGGIDENLWFTVMGPPGRIGRVTPAGSINIYPIPTSVSAPLDIAAGPDGNMWFTESAGAGAIARITIGPGVTTAGASGVASNAAVLNGSVTTNSDDTTYWFEYGTSDAYGQATGDKEIHRSEQEAGRTTTSAVSAALDGLGSSLTFHYRLVAENKAGVTFGSDRTFTTAARADSPPTPPAPSPDRPAPDPPAPVSAADVPAPRLGSTVAVEPERGVIRIKRPGDRALTRLRAGASIPVGSIIDASNGIVVLTSALSAKSRKTQSGRFWGGSFSIRQAKSLKGMTELRLRGRATGCRGKASAAAKKKRKPPRLWGRDKRGRFRTRGRNSVATVRGTKWLVEERCAGTYTKVRSGSVRVRDRKRHRTVTVKAGHSYLARFKR